MQASYNGRRKQLDLQSKEIDDLRAALSTKTDALNKVLHERAKASADEKDVRSVVSALETDVTRMQKEAHQLGSDLKRLRNEKTKAEVKYADDTVRFERVCKQNRAEIRLLKEQLQQAQNQHHKADASSSYEPFILSDRISMLTSNFPERCRRLS